MKNTKTLNELEAPGVLEDEESERLNLPEEEEISLLDVVIVLARNRRRILRTTLVVAILGLLTAVLLPVRYTATTSLLPPQQTSPAGSALLAQLGSLSQLANVAGGSSLPLKSPNDLEIALLKSRTVEDAVIQRFHLAELYHKKKLSATRDKLEKVVDIESSTKDPLIRISATDSDPQRAADLANGYVDEFRQFSATLAVTEASQRRLFFENQLRDAKDNLANAEEDLKRNEEKTGLIQLDSQTRAAISAAATLRAEIAAKQVEIRALELYATGENPGLQTAQAQLDGMKAELEKMGAGNGGAAPTLLKGGMQQQGMEYLRKLRDVRYYETIFELLARQLEAAKVDEARQGALIQVVDKAVKPDHHSFPKRTWIVLGSIGFGLIVGIALAFSSEGLKRISRNPSERARLDALRETYAKPKK